MLDGVDLFCGTGDDRDLVGVTLRIYSEFFIKEIRSSYYDNDI